MLPGLLQQTEIVPQTAGYTVTMLLSFLVFHFFDKNVKNPALCCTFPRQICTKSQKRFFVEAF